MRSIEVLTAENERERYSAEVARTEVAKCLYKLEHQAERLKDQAEMFSQLKLENAALLQAKTVAEREAAVSAARFEAEQEKSIALQSDKATLTAQLANQAVILAQNVALVEK